MVRTDDDLNAAPFEIEGTLKRCHFADLHTPEVGQ